jgi:predicted pyridoxine 5'-phosphate oxidase superfamily flavin-nucleotide-binding protein
MVQFFDTIPPHLLSWIPLQHVFWVATAPLDAEGHVNLSPKGVKGSFHIVDDKTVWYEDLTGSGKLKFRNNRAIHGLALSYGCFPLHFNAFRNLCQTMNDLN